MNFNYLTTLIEEVPQVRTEAYLEPSLSSIIKLFYENTIFTKLFLQKSSIVDDRPWVCNFIKKETPTQVFSCEFCEIFKNTSFYGTLPAAASG